jgi:hypothetical protein
MKALLCLLVLALAPRAAAQGLGQSGDSDRSEVKRPRLTAGGGYSDAPGLAHRTGRLSAVAPLGRGLSLETSFSDHRIIRDGWLPGELYTAGFRLNARKGKNSFSAGLRSSSDRLFYSVHETDLALNAVRTIRAEGAHRFSVGLAYSSRRSFARGLPFPYVLYTYVTPRLVFNLPFSAVWKPAPGWEASAAYIPPKYFQAGVSKELSEKFRLKAEYSASAIQFDLAGRPDKAYSVFIEQDNAGLWTYYTPAGNYTFSLWTGWAVKGKYYRGKTYDEYRDKRPIRGAPAASLNVTRYF